MTEPKTQTERAKDFARYSIRIDRLEGRSSNMLSEREIEYFASRLIDFHVRESTSQVEAATSVLREQLTKAEAVVNECYNHSPVDGTPFDLAQEYLKKHGGE